MIETMKHGVVWNGRKGGTTWFHPRACMMPGKPNPIALMTCQSITGSDVFGQVHWSVSTDMGASWTDPAPIDALGRRPHPDGIEDGVCDVVPEYHPATGLVLAMGHNVYYKDNKLIRPSEGRYPVYVVRSKDGQWSDRRKLEWNDPRGSAIYTCGCGQRVTLDDGQILVPISFGPLGRKDRAVGSVLCSFDGREVKIVKCGNELRLAAGRGLLEPSMTRFQGRFYMTIRAEDNHGYVTVSDDGLHWADIAPWRWDDGEPLTMSTTQQHWLTHSRALFLVYTRKAEENVNVMRWRAPLYVAQVDPATLRLMRDSERVVLPLVGDGVNDATHVARMGNFHVTNASPQESWVTVGETLPADGWRGDTLLARIRWAVPNGLADL
ncbi:MAG: sialidase family protein [Planctomycetota bacterium]